MSEQGYRLFIGNKNYSSWSLRPWILMKKLGIPFEEMQVTFSDQPRQEHFLAFSPTAKVPCLRHGDLTIWDSLAITEYLAERHKGVWPEDRDTRAWARSIVCEMHSGFQALRSAAPMNVSLRVEMNALSDTVKRDIERIDAIWSEGLRRYSGTYLCGDEFTAADAFFAPVVFRWRTYGFELGQVAEGYAHVMSVEPHMLDWEMQGMGEEWIDEAHEDESRAAGRIVKDMRLRPASS